MEAEHQPFLIRQGEGIEIQPDQGHQAMNRVSGRCPCY